MQYLVVGLFGAIFRAPFWTQFLLAGLIAWGGFALQQQEQARIDARAALANQPPPEAIGLADVPKETRDARIAEVRVRGLFLTDHNTRLVQKRNGITTSEKLMYVLGDIDPATGKPVARAAMLIEPGEKDAFINWIIAHTSFEAGLDTPLVEIDGLILHPAQSTHAFKALSEQQAAVDKGFYFIDPFVEGRAAALAAKPGEALASAQWIYGAAGFVALIGLSKLMRSRGRTPRRTKGADATVSDAPDPAARSRLPDRVAVNSARSGDPVPVDRPEAPPVTIDPAPQPAARLVATRGPLGMSDAPDWLVRERVAAAFSQPGGATSGTAMAPVGGRAALGASDRLLSSEGAIRQVPTLFERLVQARGISMIALAVALFVLPMVSSPGNLATRASGIADPLWRALGLGGVDIGGTFSSTVSKDAPSGAAPARIAMPGRAAVAGESVRSAPSGDAVAAPMSADAPPQTADAVAAAVPVVPMATASGPAAPRVPGAGTSEVPAAVPQAMAAFPAGDAPHAASLVEVDAGSAPVAEGKRRAARGDPLSLVALGPLAVTGGIALALGLLGIGVHNARRRGKAPGVDPFDRFAERLRAGRVS